MTMETANANITLSDTFESKEPLPSAQRALSVECTNEPSYADVSPPICYAGVSTHEPVDPSLHVSYAIYFIKCLCWSLFLLVVV